MCSTSQPGDEGRGDEHSPRAWRNREPYGMRDTFATLNLTDGAPLDWISEQMGHSEIDTTRKHNARWQRTREYAILDSLDAARAGTGLKTDSAAKA
jgi:integrase